MRGLLLWRRELDGLGLKALLAEPADHTPQGAGAATRGPKRETASPLDLERGGGSPAPPVLEGRVSERRKAWQEAQRHRTRDMEATGGCEHMARRSMKTLIAPRKYQNNGLNGPGPMG